MARKAALALIGALALMTAGCSSTPARPQSTATLQNTYWKLTSLGGKSVEVSDKQREPNLVLQSEQSRLAGHGGCNRMMGTYKLEGDQLSFGPIAGTRMACAQGMEQEDQFHKALARVARWRIVGETLELFDAAGASVAQFESRYLR